MGFSGNRRLRHSYSLVVVLMMVIALFHIWVCIVGAIRVPPANPLPKHSERTTQPMKKAIDKKPEEVDLYEKYFHGSASDLVKNIGAENGFQDSKRRIPSCPDPLHN